jgi:hypothetical protein
MLNRHLNKFVENLDRLQDLGYRELPTHYEEAALIYLYGRKKPVPQSSYPPRPYKRQQIEDFTRLLNRYGGDRQAASRELSKELRNTYFYYYLYTSFGTKR